MKGGRTAWLKTCKSGQGKNIRVLVENQKKGESKEEKEGSIRLLIAFSLLQGRLTKSTVLVAFSLQLQGDYRRESLIICCSYNYNNMWYSITLHPEKRKYTIEPQSINM